MALDERTLKDLIKRRHPFYEKMAPHWDFLEQTYRGGREWFDGNVFRYLKEGDQEYKDRVDRAYRFNHSREIVNLINKYVFKGDVHRSREDQSLELQAFWKRATREGFAITEFMKLADVRASTMGRVWIMTDSTAAPGMVSLADQKERQDRVYAYIVGPRQVLDVGYDDNGDPLWILLLEQKRDDEDPFTSSGEVADRYRLFTRTEWFLIGEKTEGRKKALALLDQGVHGLGVVPGFPLDNLGISDNPYFSTALIDDIAYLDRAVANYLSNLDAIIQDQTFSQLAMPAQGVTPGDDTYTKLVELGTKRIFLYDGGTGGQPFFLSPDPKQAELIVSVIKTIINEIYHSVGVAGERTKQDNSQGIDNSSGVAKAYDFERVKSLLVSKAEGLERAENKLAHLVKLWHGEVNPEDEVGQVARYPRDFDIRGIRDELELASKLSLLRAPDLVLQEQMTSIVTKMFPALSRELKEKMQSAIKAWQPNTVTDDLPTPAGVGAGGNE